MLIHMEHSPSGIFLGSVSWIQLGNTSHFMVKDGILLHRGEIGDEVEVDLTFSPCSLPFASADTVICVKANSQVHKSSDILATT
jgi:hypothetical protein